MKKPNGEYRSRVYTDRPEYADYDAPRKFQAITGIIMTRLRQHPKAVCSYSGGSDSDILIDLIERARMIAPSLPPVKYLFFNTGLEMKATKDHVKDTAEKYGVEIETVKPKVNIVTASRNGRKKDFRFRSRTSTTRPRTSTRRDRSSGSAIQNVRV